MAPDKTSEPQQKAETRQPAPEQAVEPLETPVHTLAAVGAVQLARRAPRLLTPGTVLHLQRSVGNRAVARLLQPVVQREVTTRDGWDTRYRTKESRTEKSYEEYRDLIGSNSPEIKAASEWETGGKKGRPVNPVALTSTELADILKPEIPPSKITPEQKQQHDDRLASSLDQINQAFETMKIDTVEAQASFLAHMAGETGTLQYLEERGGKNLSYAPFYGRGTAHTTYEYNYVQTLAYMETWAKGLEDQADAKQAEKDGMGEDVEATKKIELLFQIIKLRDQAKQLRAAWEAIKGNIDNAAQPPYAFLFSAAYMHMAGGVRDAAALSGQSTAAFAGPGNEDKWVTGQSQTFEASRTQAEQEGKGGKVKAFTSAIDRAKVKKATFERAVRVLSPKAGGTGGQAAGATAQAAAPAAQESTEG